MVAESTLDTARATAATEPPKAAPVKEARFYRPELDGLRFFAFFAVYVHHTILFHAGDAHHHLPPALADALGAIGGAGAFGVDLFFALSAFLITELLLREREARGAIDVKAFWARRILRIWPLYFAFLLLSMALATRVAGEDLSWSELAAFALFSGNWISVAHPIHSIAAPLWSVSLEEQFYIAWPLAVRRATARRLVGIAVAILVVGLVSRAVLAYGGHSGWISKGSFTRADGIAAGVILAVALRKWPLRAGAGARVALVGAGVVALVGISAFAPVAGDQGPPLRLALGWTFVALACAAILAGALRAEGPLGALLSHPVTVRLGRVSYGLYVYHQLGLLLAARVFPRFDASTKDWAGHFVLGLAATIALALASYAWLEQPFLRLKQRKFTVVPSRPDGEAVRATTL